MDTKDIFKFVVIVIAIAGCGIQLRSTLVSYFNYSSGTRTSYSPRDVQELMSLSLCTPYIDVINYDMKPSLTGIKGQTRRQRLLLVPDIVTVRDILTMTPGTESLFAHCSMRDNSSRVMNMKFNDSCLDSVSVSKYFTQEFICYMFTPKQLKISTSTYTDAIDFPRLTYSFGLKNNFSSNIWFIKFIVHSRVAKPSISRKYSSMRAEDACNKTWFGMRYSRNYVTYLGYPYDKFECSDDANENDVWLENCVMNKTIRTFGRVAYDLNTDFPYDYLHMSRELVSDPKIAATMDNIISSCKASCTKRYCKSDYTTTSYDSDDSFEEDEVMYISVETPESAEIMVIYYPSVGVLDFIVYTMGAIGAWFGFAFIHIDLHSLCRIFKLFTKLIPEKVIRKKKKKIFFIRKRIKS